LELEKTLNTSIGAYNEAIDSLLDVIRQWYWNDPVSALYGELFVHSAILDPAYDEKEMTERLERDVLYKLPPGYKDARKKDDGIGDLLIWQTILDAGVKNKKSVIFVSLDQKADWWSQSEGSALYPRFELVDEFRRASDGQSFHAIKFSRFLNLYGASKDVVEEVRKEEQQVGAFHFDSGAPWSYEALIAQNSVYDWLKASYPYCLITSHEKGFDYVIVDQENRRIAVEIKLFRDAHISVRRFKDIASQILKLLKVERFDEVLIILVGSDEKAAFSLLAKIDGLKAALPMAKMVTGFLSSSGDFFTYPYTEEP
jgi:hypothetical protein